MGDTRDNRLAGLGPLAGAVVGVAVGALSGLARTLQARQGRLLPAPVVVVLTGVAAMALADVPMKVLGVSDPADWRAQDWAAGAVPHLVYGVVTAATLSATT